jgi:hypothetical protein
MKKWLEIGTNLVVIGMAGALVFTFFHYRLAPWQQQLPPAALIQPGDTLKPVAGVSLAPAGDTLLLAIRNGCEFCENSMPFYKKLLELKAEGKISVPIVAVLPDSPDVAKKFVSSHGLSLPILPGVSLTSLGVLGTPTMILASAARTVQHVWVGEQNQAQETGVIEQLESVAAPVPSAATAPQGTSAKN